MLCGSFWRVFIYNVVERMSSPHNHGNHSPKNNVHLDRGDVPAAAGGFFAGVVDAEDDLFQQFVDGLRSGRGIGEGGDALAKRGAELFFLLRAFLFLFLMRLPHTDQQPRCKNQT